VLIGEAARRAGVSRDTVRLYTHLGLVACTLRPAGSRTYADYDKDAVELIKNIKVAQSIGFSLSELVPIAAAYVAGRLDDDRQRLLLEAKLAEIEDIQGKLRQMSQFLRSKLNDLPTSDLHRRQRAAPEPRAHNMTICEPTRRTAGTIPGTPTWRYGATG
jgi:MerR family transcriptional regulator, copper efflux regulator